MKVVNELAPEFPPDESDEDAADSVEVVVGTLSPELEESELDPSGPLLLIVDVNVVTSPGRLVPGKLDVNVVKLPGRLVMIEVMPPGELLPGRVEVIVVKLTSGLEGEAELLVIVERTLLGSLVVEVMLLKAGAGADDGGCSPATVVVAPVVV